MEVIKNVSQAIINSGDSFTYSIQVVNNSFTTDAFATTVTDLLPAGISYVSDDSGGNYDPVTGIWDAGTVLSNSSKTLLLLVRLMPIQAVCLLPIQQQPAQ